MPTVTEALVEGFSRTPDLVTRALDGLSEADLIRRVDPEANTVAWLIWHTARMQDGQVTRAQRALGSAGADQAWTTAGYADRFGLDVGDDEVGYGMTPDQVAEVKAPADLLQAYHQAVNDATVEWLRGLDDTDYDRVVDDSWDPPVTLLARLVSIEQDAVQHLGQAALVRGVLQRT
ncbi:mycothiol transferase [Lapillicoccus sp.]|uniref:mycothiol transferase n=1 Tax=Lapillicoccus sp. TaxID=1909287 RepID=UPI00326389BB